MIENADRLFLVGNGTDDPRRRPLEKQAGLNGETPDPTVRTDLVLLWPAGTTPENTRDLLEPRTVDQHHHIRQGRERNLERLSRFLRGRAVGLTLGGGGARGLAHVGVIKAFRN